MKISTKGRYGLRALVDLAFNEGDTAVSLTNIAKRQKISVNYLEQVFGTLRKAGVVKSTKGPQGGYMLAKRAEDLYLSEILEVLEGKFSIIDEAILKTQSDLIQKAINDLVWNKINDQVNEFLESTTLSDLVKEYRKLDTEMQEMYYI